MAKNKKGGLITKLLMGSEKSEGFARASLPSNRWELFWDILKGGFWKIVLLNLLILLFCIPVLLVILLRSSFISGFGSMYPFSQGFGVGYLAPDSFVGLSESIVLNANFQTLLFLPLAVLIASVGISGGAYVARNMVWTEGVFVANDFWHGIKVNFKQIVLIGLLYSLFFFLTTLSISFSNLSITQGTSPLWVFYLSKVLSIIFITIYSFMTLHMISMSVTYELSFFNLFKNSFLFTIGLLPQSVFFAFLGIIPFLLLKLGSFFLVIGLILVLFLGFSVFLLVWTDFSQWAFDKFVNDKVPGAKKNKGIYEKVKNGNAETLRKYKEQMVLVPRNSLNSRPIKPITDDELKIEELPESFNRSDLIKLGESKQKIYDDNAKYIEEHKNDEQYLPNEKDALIQKENEERNKRIEAAKRELSKRKYGDK